MYAKQKDGKTLAWHLNVVYEKSGILPPDLDIEPIPVEVQHIWGYFIELNRKRTNGGMEKNPISDEAILAWQRRHNIVLTPFEGDCIDELDEVFLSTDVGGDKPPEAT